MTSSSGSKPRVICLMGPTASGKTDLAIEIAQALDCELISVDSALVYRGLDIGSAKPDYPHHLVDVRDPAQPYSAADFVSDAEAAVQAILARGRTPLLVGGTMLYFKAFLEGLAQMPAADPSVRAAIEAEAASSGWPALHAELARVDPDSAARIHPNHSQRLSRALEVYRVSGTPLSQWQDAGDRPGALARYDVRQMALSPARREVLHQRIELRFTHMLEAGFLDEVARLRARPDLDETLPAVRAVGYRQLWQHLAGEYDLEEATRRAVAATRQLAKRQLTWLRKWPDLTWLLTDDSGVRLVPAGEGQNAAESAETPLLAALRLLDQPRV